MTTPAPYTHNSGENPEKPRRLTPPSYLKELAARTPWSVRRFKSILNKTCPGALIRLGHMLYQVDLDLATPEIRAYFEAAPTQ